MRLELEIKFGYGYGLCRRKMGGKRRKKQCISEIWEECNTKKRFIHFKSIVICVAKFWKNTCVSRKIWME